MFIIFYNRKGGPQWPSGLGGVASNGRLSPL